MDLKLAYLYPTLMNLYGDRGNVQTLAQRCRWRGINIAITEVGLGESPNFSEFDLVFFGGGQDKEQFKISEDLLDYKASNLIAAVKDGLVVLSVCGGYQLLGEFYRPLQGPILKGIALMDLRTEGGTWRAIGNILVESVLDGLNGLNLVGFENHSGRTYLGPGCREIGKVITGFGNNGEDGGEGARFLNCFGTYLHGPLLPKNPVFADYLISLALERRYGRSDLERLDDYLENETRHQVINRIKRGQRLKGMVR